MTENSYFLGDVLAAWIAMLRTGSTTELASLLDTNVAWRGVLPGQICHNREEVLNLLTRQGRRHPRLTRIEAEERGDRVVVSVHSPDFPELEGHARKDVRSIVFSFRNGVIINMDAFGSRDAAFESVT